MVKEIRRPPGTKKAIIVGAGIGGLVSALLLAVAGVEVVVCEMAATPGGKLREAVLGTTRIDAGPTVLTMLPVFEEIFAAAGTTLAAQLKLEPVPVLARHAWDDEARLDLVAARGANAAAIGDFAGAKAARLYQAFAGRAEQVYNTLEARFMQAPQPGLGGLIQGGGWRQAAGLLRISPFTSLWDGLGRYFPDPRLRQLFARYATYCGSSPFMAPATLMLIAHAESLGVWRINGGMYGLAKVLARLAAAQGVVFRYNSKVMAVLSRDGKAAGVRLDDGDRLLADAVIINADLGAVADGSFGEAPAAGVAVSAQGAARSFSALTWAITGRVSGAPLAHHNVFFGGDYRQEFTALANGALPDDPTVYLCAQTKSKFLCLINAPANGDTTKASPMETEEWFSRVQARLRRCGVVLTPKQMVVTGPTAFNRLFPGNGGGLYGRALTGWRDPFRRPGAASLLPGMYLAGGSVHPGPGLPMAAISGRLAAAQVLADFASMSRSVPVVMPGGISTPLAMMGSTPAP